MRIQPDPPVRFGTEDARRREADLQHARRLERVRQWVADGDIVAADRVLLALAASLGKPRPRPRLEYGPWVDDVRFCGIPLVIVEHTGPGSWHDDDRELLWL